MSRNLPLGRALELKVLRLFRDDGFRIHHDPGTARPRQTDIFAIGHDMHLRVEAYIQYDSEEPNGPVSYHVA